MHFITENELRTSFRKNPFDKLTVSDKERLTPEAKQFVLDKKIQIIPVQNNKTKIDSKNNQLNTDKKINSRINNQQDSKYVKNKKINKIKNEIESTIPKGELSNLTNLSDLDNLGNLVNLSNLNETQTNPPNNLLLSYKLVLSAELLEAAILAMKIELTMSQKLLQLEQRTMKALSIEPIINNSFVEKTVDFVQLEAVHIFSEQGLLLIKIKRIQGIILFIQTNCPQYVQPLNELNQELNNLSNKLIGDAYE